MKLLDTLTQKLKKQQKTPEELFLTLVVDSDHIAGACWHMGDTKSANLTHAVSRKISVDSWEQRTRAADEIITALEERSGTTNIHKVIFGFPASYLTADGDIDKTIRSELKTFTQELELTPIGFVPVHQALMYRLKKADGVPPTAIVIGVYRKEIIIALYKIGVCIGVQTIPNTKDRIMAFEMVLKSFIDVEVLPSRILLYGANSKILEDFRIEMIGHPWPTRANFLHFPKVVVLPPDAVVSGVSEAGSSELSVSSAFPVEEKTSIHEPIGKQYSEPLVSGEEKEGMIEEDEYETERENGKKDIKSEFDENGNDNNSPDSSGETDDENEESNVRVVTPEEIGFHTNEDIIEMGSPFPGRQKPISHGNDDKFQEEVAGTPQKRQTMQKPVKHFISTGLSAFASVFSGFSGKLSATRFPIISIAIAGIIILIVLLWMILTVFPKVSITLSVLPKQIESTASAVIDSSVTAPDEETLTIQGEKMEKTVNGEKTISTTGKKSIGDPAKGTVSIYNKTLSSRTFKKGTVLSASNLQFTLDDDVQIASASESIGSITFGKGTVTVTASSIGAQSNLSVNKEFSFKDISESVAIARNEQAFTGGTSKEVTVVSRADQDKLIAEITPELIEKAKEELFAGVDGTKKLIEETIETTVAKKEFTEELNQETTQLHGKVSINVSGIAYDEQILKDILFEKAKTSVPTGYELIREDTTVTIGKMTVMKNGTIKVVLTLKGKAKPFLNIQELKKMIAGKKVTESEQTLRGLTGVSDVVIQFTQALFKQTIPKESNITIDTKE